MKQLKILVFGLGALACSCKPSEQPDNNNSEKKITYNVMLAHALNDALQLAQQNAHQENFSGELVSRDSNVSISTHVTLGNLFENQIKHCLIKRKTPLTVYTDVYSLSGEDNHFEKVLSDEQLTLSYDSTIIQDVNGDKHNDLLVSWYGASGCDLKKYQAVYLYTNNGKFSQALSILE